MYARVWKFNLLPDKVEEFAAACREVGKINRKRPEFRGLVVVRGGPRDAPEGTVVSVWDSLESLRASESAAFQQGVERALACCMPDAVLQEEDVLICNFYPPRKISRKQTARKSARKPARKKRRR